MSNKVEKSKTVPEEEPAVVVATDDKPKKPKKRGKAKIVILAVVIVVVLLFGGGGAVYATQHSNPAFCNVVCHTPMDPYVASYQNGTSINPLQTGLTAPLSVTIHKDAGQDIVCVTCHTDGLDTTIGEGISWLTGDYSVPLENLTLTLKEPKEHQRAAVETCLRSGCHEGISSLEDLKASTADLKRNPHDSHNGDQDCTTCHQTHEQSVAWCTQCHADATIPDGWLTYTEQQKQIKEAKDAAK
jgi:hypothetical protein